MNEDPEEKEFPAQPAPDIRFDDIIGLEDKLEEIEETLIENTAGNVPDELRTMSVVIYGKRGSGKRRVLRAITGELGEHGYSNRWLESTGQYLSAEMVESFFKQGLDDQPTALVVDSAGVFNDELAQIVDNRMEEARSNGDNVVLLSVLDEGDMYGSGIRRYLSAMDLVFEMERPGIERRRGILRDRFERIDEEVEEVDAGSYDYARLARETDRFGVNNLENLVRRTVTAARHDPDVEPPIGEEKIAEVVAEVDGERAERVIDEETLIAVDVPEVTFDDVGGHEDAKRKLIERTRQALEHEDIADDLELDFTGGILLHGPPGTGKTMLVRALANELDYTFIPINAPKLKSGRGGPTEKIPALFYRAQRNAPTILFFDEFDSVGVQRGSLQGEEMAVNTLLTELDGIEQLDRIVVIAATNRPETLDPALLRPGRFDYHIEIDEPGAEAQKEIFENHTSRIPLEGDVTADWFVTTTEDLTGAEIAAICERAVTIYTNRTGEEVTNGLDVELSREEFQVAYEEFRKGRLHQYDLGNSPAFR